MEKRFLLLRILVDLGAFIPLFLLAIAFISDRLGANPIQALEQKSGDAALIFLILTLACSPLLAIFGWRGAPVVRRSLGLWTFAYAAFHMLVFAWLDFGLSWGLLREEVLRRPFILLGVSALLILLLLAITTIPLLKRAMGASWKWLQRSLYVAAILVVFHFALARKGNIFTLRGDVGLPLAAFSIILFLLILRIPPVSRKLAGGWQKILGRSNSRTQHKD
jgi:sulfoxide reductase heme-binding subunit YedZ